MREQFIINANLRAEQGKGASRRLRKEEQVPGIIYGTGCEPMAVQVSHKDLFHLLTSSSIYTALITVQLEGKTELVILRDLQRHPCKARILHFDFQRVKEDQNLLMRIPIRFVGEELAPGVKISGGVISRLISNVVVSCLPKYLPEYIEIDLSKMELNQTIKLSNLNLPEGVELLDLMHNKDTTVVTLYALRDAENSESESTTSS